jgi:hypothetical protein
VAPRPFHRDHEWLGICFNNWKASGVVTVGSRRPVSATATGDADQDGNNSNDRLPGVSRDSLLGPDYATTESSHSNLLNRDNKGVQITQDGFISNSTQFVQTTNTTGINVFPAQ